MNTQSKTPIATFGLDKAMMNTLDFLLSDDQKIKFELTTTQDELISIFNLTTKIDVESLKEYRKKFFDRPIIVISNNAVKGKNLIHLRLPITPRRLLDALTEAVDWLDSGSSQLDNNKNKLKMSPGVLEHSKKKPEITFENKAKKLLLSQADIDLDDPKAVDEIRYSEESFLQGRLLKAYSKGKEGNTNIQIYTPHGVFHYYPREHMAHVEVNEHSLRNLASVPDAITSIMTEFDKKELENIENKKLVSADELLWKATIWASRGRIPMHTDIDQPFSLKHWPNFTRLMITPHAMQLTDFWLGNTSTLRGTIAIMGIPQRYVFSFYCAALTLDLLKFDVAPPSADEKKTAKKAPSRLKGFIGKLLDYVKPGDGEEI